MSVHKCGETSLGFLYKVFRGGGWGITKINKATHKSKFSARFNERER
jgi:hypothetical protein